MVAVEVSNGGPKSIPVTRGDGVSVDLQELVKLAGPARRVDLPGLGSRRLQTMLAGPFPSPCGGRGMDFEEVRGYQPGDDVRAIDWRVTARTGRLHTKLYEEERDRPFLGLADLGLTMHFGTRGCFKCVQAVRVAALLAWAARP